LAAAARVTEFSVASDLPYILMDDPNPFDTVENLERHLAELRAMPEFMFKDSRIAHMQKIIDRKKALEAEAKNQS
jgi:hypothetical protein